MLYDPKWEVQVKADPFSLESLIVWLEKQPAEKQYCYGDNGRCLLADYFTSVGYENVSVGACDFHHGPNLEMTAKFSDDFSDIAVNRPWTFGAALERARAALARV
jgi:hypothetical protein